MHLNVLFHLHLLTVASYFKFICLPKWYFWLSFPVWLLLNKLRPYHAHNEGDGGCLQSLLGGDVGDQVVQGLCNVVKHSTDCKKLTEADIFRKQMKEERQKLALELTGV